jgi:hypothetical protein
MNSASDAIVFGEVVFPDGGVQAWCRDVGHRIAELHAFDEQNDEELAQLLVTPVGVALRCWFFAGSFQEFCPKLEAIFSQAAHKGGRGDITFLGVGEGPAYRLVLDGSRAIVHRVPSLGFEHPTVQEIALAVETKARHRRGLVEAIGEVAQSPAEREFFSRGERRAVDRR